MGIMTRTAMRDEIVNRIGRSDIDSQIETYLYRAVLDLATYKHFHDNETSATLTQSAATNTASLPADFLWPVRLEYNDSSVVVNCTFKDLIYVRELYTPGSTGRPDYYARWGASAYFDKDADQTYGWKLYYKQRPANFADGSAVSPLGGEWDEALIRHATSNSFARLRQWDLAEKHMSWYFSYVKGHLGQLGEEEASFNESFMGDIDYDPFTF